MKYIQLLIALLSITSIISEEEVLPPVTKEDIDKICEGVKLKEFHITKGLTLKDFILSLGIKSENHRFLRDYLLEKKIPTKDDIPKEMLVFLVLIIFIPITIVTWIMFCCSWCCHCGVFKRKNTSLIKKIIVFCIAVGFFLGVIIASICSFTQSKHFGSHINGFTCSLSKFYYSTEFGEDKEEPPRWIGLKSISNLANQTEEQINQISENKEQAFVGLDGLKDKTNEYQDLIADANIEFYDKKVTSPKPEEAETEQITPKYSYEYSTSENEPKSYLRKIAEDFGENITYPVEMLQYFKEATDQLCENSDTIVENLQGISDYSQTFESAINQIGSKTIGAINNYKETASKVFFAFFQILFGMFIGYSLIIIAFLVLYTLFRCCLFRLFIHILWNVLLIFIILSFTVAILFGLLTEFTNQLAPAMAEVLSYDFLVNNSFIELPETGVKLIDTCLNQDGNLAEAMNISLETTQEIDKYFEAVENLTQIKKQIEDLGYSEALKETIEGMNQYKNDYAKATNETYAENDVTLNLNNLNQKTNNLELCQTQDIFLFNSNGCPEGYGFKTKDSYIKGEQNCLLISGFTKEDVANLYGDCAEKENIAKGYNGLYNFYLTNKEFLVKIDNHLQTMEESYLTIAPELATISGNAIGLGNNFREIMKPFMSQAGFNEIFNCNYIKKDMIRFIDIIFNEFRNDCQYITTGTFIASVFSYLGLFFLMTSIYRHGNKKKEEEDEELNEKKKKKNIQMQEFDKNN